MARSRKKLNIYQSESISSILRRPMTSGNDLTKLAKKLGIVIQLGWAKDYDPTLESNPKVGQIINVDPNEIGGTHWVATYMDKYFDPFGLPAVRQMKHLNWSPLWIQDVDGFHCGQYSLLWIYYNMIGEEDKYFSLFNPHYYDK